MHAGFRDALERGDLTYLRRYWRECVPTMPQPENYGDAAIVMHHARTTAESVSMKARAYSHRWLEERAFPSGLPDHLKPKAERLYPKAVEGVMISINTSNPYLKPATVDVRKAMEYAVNDIYADDDHPDPALVRRQMEEARAREWRALFG